MITAASIEANGWVLRVTHTSGPGSFASYALTPDTASKLVLNASHPGFAPAGGIAVATPRLRSIAATKPLRRPVNPASPTTPVIDETDLGGGAVRVRLALAEFVYPGDTLSLDALAGWRDGEGAASGVAVTNGSTLAAPPPVFRWADVPYQRHTGPFELELAAFAHHPNGLAPLAGVKFTVTDGVNTRTVWATALATSTRHGDGLRVYRATIDPGTAPALTAGLLRCDAELHPWLGAVRSTDPLGTRSMAGLQTLSFQTSAERPMAVAWDPAGTRYPPAFVMLDPVGGTATAAAGMVQGTLAAAKAVAVKALNVSTALQACYLANRGAPAANGQAALTRMTDNLAIVLPAGTSLLGTTAVTSGATSLEAWPMIVGDPENAAPRANCILQGPTTAPTLRLSRVRLANLRLELDTAALGTAVLAYHWADDIEMRGRAGRETTSAFMAAATGGAQFYTRCRVWRSGKGMAFGASGSRPFLIRGCEASRLMEGLAVLGNAWLSNAADPFAPAPASSTDSNATGGWGNGNTGVGDIGSQEDVIVAGNDLRAITRRAWVSASLSAAAAGTLHTSKRRLVFANNVCERIAAGASPEPFWSMGEDALASMRDNIVEGNSFAGERVNCMYSDPLPLTVADTNTQLNDALGNRLANNVFDWCATKHDDFSDPQTASVRGTSDGYRPQMVETWSVLYGVGFEGNVDLCRHAAAPNFRFEYFGRRGSQGVTPTPPGYADDRSRYGSDAGGGDYRPGVGSPLLGKGQRGSSDRDRLGTARAVPFAAGGLAGDAVAVLAPAAARSRGQSAMSALSWQTVLVAAAARHRSGAAIATLTWRGTLVPGDATSRTRAAAAFLGTDALALAAGRTLRVAAEARATGVGAG